VRDRYVRFMDALNTACVFVAGVCMVVITIIIPYGVYCRYVLNSAASWPEPAAVLLMIVLSFFSAVVCYREHLHIGVSLLPNALSGLPKLLLGWFVELCMLGVNLFMLWYGINLVQVTWHQSIAEFPGLSVGVAYLPIPIGGAVTILFVVERLWTQGFFGEPPADAVSAISSE
jgi:TRAP-type C4-dicarboxylate transport system permease small subunit